MATSDFCDKLHGKLAGRAPKLQNEADYFSSAVVLPLVKQQGELSLLFEVRSAQLAWQPGEICFPGGRIEAGDANPRTAAMRETSEELGLTPNDLVMLGDLDYMVSPIGVIIYPFVGYIADFERIKPSSDEVAEVFTVPLKYLLTTEPLVASMEVATQPLDGFPFERMPATYPRGWRRRATYPVLFYNYGDYTIWGLTARLLYNFVELCREMKVE
jgi:8-oxo-dGTP pyrophosphatase MutT (NUDIX family)